MRNQRSIVSRLGALAVLAGLALSPAFLDGQSQYGPPYGPGEDYPTSDDHSAQANKIRDLHRRYQSLRTLQDNPVVQDQLGATRSNSTGQWIEGYGRTLAEYFDARSSIESCEQAKNLGDRENICRQATRTIERCVIKRDAWLKEKAAILAEGNGSAIDNRFLKTDMWLLAAMDLLPCPSTTSLAGLTPAEQVESWKAEAANLVPGAPVVKAPAPTVAPAAPTAPGSPQNINAVLEKEIANFDDKAMNGNAGAEGALAGADATAASDEAAAKAAEKKVRDAQAFEARLKALTSAGQIFALADEMGAAGRASESREALDALVARFPDDPLAMMAAEQITKLEDKENAAAAAATAKPAPAPAPAPAPVAPQSPVQQPAAQSGSRSYDDCVRDYQASGTDEKLNAWTAKNSNNVVEQLRGIIATTDLMVSYLKPCGSDPRTQPEIDDILGKRAASIRSCQAVAADPSYCLTSPFR